MVIFAAGESASAVQDVAVARESQALARHALRQHLGGPRVRVRPAVPTRHLLPLRLRPRLRPRVAHPCSSVHHPATHRRH